MSDDISSDVTALTVQLLSAFVANNSVPSEALADLIRSTRAALTDNLPATASAAAAAEEKGHVPAVSIRKSLASDDHIISLIDGKPYKTLKRHLASHGLSPDDYRARYGLPKSYPLVARSYSKTRRAVAQKMGLGRKPASAEPSAEAALPDAAATGDMPASGGAAKRKGRITTAPQRNAKAAPPPAPTIAAPQERTDPAEGQAESKGASGGRKPRKRLSIAAPQEAVQSVSAPANAAKAAKPKKAVAGRSKAKSEEKPAPRTRRKAEAAASE